MQTFIKTDVEFSANANIPQQAIFQAQKHFNNTGHPECTVISAEFVDGGIMVEYDGPEMEYTDPNRYTIEDHDLAIEESAAFNEAVKETVGKSDGELKPNDDDFEIPGGSIGLDSGEVVEQIGPDDMNLENIDREPEKLICEKCGKKYSRKGRGPDFYEAHIEKCEG